MSDAQLKLFEIKDTKLRAIDHKTYYNVPGMINKLHEDVSNGKYGAVSDVAVSLRTFEDGKLQIHAFHFGASNNEVAISMFELAKRRVLDCIDPQ